MVIYHAATLDNAFSALANPTRRAILAQLARGTQTVLELASLFEISQPAVTKHLNILERAGLIQRRKAGRHRHCSLTAQALEAPGDWIAQVQAHWEQRLAALEQYLEGDPSGVER